MFVKHRIQLHLLDRVTAAGLRRQVLRTRRVAGGSRQICGRLLFHRDCKRSGRSHIERCRREFRDQASEIHDRTHTIRPWLQERHLRGAAEACVACKGRELTELIGCIPNIELQICRTDSPRET